MTELDSTLAVASRPVMQWWQLSFWVERLTVGTSDWLMLCAAASTSASQAEPALSVVYALVAMVALSGTRRPALTPAPLAEVPGLFARLGVAGVLVAPLAFLVGAPVVYLLQVLISIVAVLIGRTIAYAGVRGSRRRGWLSVPAVVIGSDAATTRTIELLEAHPESGLVVDAVAPEVDAIDPTTRALVVVEADARSLDRLSVIAYEVGSQWGEVLVTPELAGRFPASRFHRSEAIAGVPFVRLAPPATRRAGWRAKRAFDLVSAALAIIVFSPVLLFAAIGTRLSSRGPIFFRQPRVGRNGREFTMYKFRTFPVDHVDDKFSRAHDECPLAFGRFLRRTSIDELPQLFNVLRGDMSIVGPRPERPHFARPFVEAVPGYAHRHRVPGGITGAAQVKGYWGNCSIEARIDHDNRYIDDWSFWNDLSVLARTPAAIARKSRS